ncbi:TetR/AcrR family transcriptional regulator [Georgenia faecalis]|uniref:TetR/AcrR family transcriptional regulator n=1 Tax=Georgenia faecalis TaxID=2483799 RepID=UPI000FD8B4CE|nr:TetR family transcriptional regulator [Georgenia faecalis]
MPRATRAQSEATAARVLDAAWALFAAQGYPGVGLEEVAQRAGVTRGAVYHHYGSKTGLFHAVHARAQAQVAAAVEAAAAGSDDPWEALEAGSRAFLDASLGDRVRQVMLIDAPVVLGLDAWRAEDARGSAHLLGEALTELAAAGVLRVGSVPACAALLSGAMNEAALWAATTADPRAAVDDAWDVLRQMLAALRT